MTKEMEKEIDELYESLGIDKSNNKEKRNIQSERTDDFFQKRWDSSFFANTMRY